MDLHAGQIQGYFDIPVDHLFAAPVLVGHFQNLHMLDLAVIAPDAGGVERARAYAKRLGADLAIIDKRRDKEKANHVDVINVVGDVEGRTCLIVDDMIDTAGTLTKSAQALREQGARAVYACATHAVFSGTARQAIADSVLEQVVVTNTIPPQDLGPATGRVTCLSVAGILAEAIASIHDETSVSRLFI
jgi:ribose-phosphate pyrophosphokinase